MAEPTSDTARLEALVERARQGDRSAQDDLMRDVLPRIHAFVRLKAGDRLCRRESMSDLAHSVCRELLEELPGLQYRGSAAFFRWLHLAAERKVVDRARHWNAERRDRDREVELDARDAEEVLRGYADLVTPSRDVAAREEVERFERAFRGLPEHHREVIALSRILGLPHKDIADRIGKSEGAVRVLLYRALAELSSRLGREPG